VSKTDARSLYRSCLAMAVMTERRLYGEGFDYRIALKAAAWAFRRNSL